MESKTNWFTRLVEWIFQEKDGTKSFSVRKLLAILMGLVFTFECVHYSWMNKTVELPTPYLIIIGTVFAFYFGKAAIEKLKIVSKDKNPD